MWIFRFYSLICTGRTIEQLHHEIGKSKTCVDVYFVCFSIDNPKSLENVRKEWYPNINCLHPNVPIILVGTKKDIRDMQENEDITENLKKQKITPITYLQGSAMAKEINACKYFECSTVTREGLDILFEEAVRIYFSRMMPVCHKCDKNIIGPIPKSSNTCKGHKRCIIL